MSKKHLTSRVIAAMLAGLLVTALAVFQSAPAQAAGPNLASGKTATASSSNGQYTAGNLNDGNQASYWESSGITTAQTATIDLGASTSVNQVVLKLPTGWGSRTETLSVQGSPDGAAFSTVVASKGYVFDPGASNVVTINFTAASTRFVRVNITANTGWAAAQLSEFEIYGSGTGTTAPNLALGKTMSAKSVTQPYVASNANDGNQSSYWESAAGYPQWLQVDLGSSTAVTQVVLKVPVVNWGARTQTLAIQGSTNGTDFTDIVGSKNYDFVPASNNTLPPGELHRQHRQLGGAGFRVRGLRPDRRHRPHGPDGTGQPRLHRAGHHRADQADLGSLHR
jgi:hypothetical protein